MMRARAHRMAALCVVFALVGVAAAGCSKHIRSLLLPNQLPTVEITRAPIDTTVVCTPNAVRSCYAITLDWVGDDPDGRVDHYQYAVDPPGLGDTLWTTTNASEARVLLESKFLTPDTGNGHRLAEEPHVFAIRAVDNRGGIGPVESRGFFSFTEAPTVVVVNPLPNHLFRPLVAPSVQITWSGNDPDGVTTRKPVQYKFILLSASSTFSAVLAATNPDSLRRYYAPAFVGWDSLGGDTTTTQFTNLTPGQTYLFAVVAFDEAGAYSPIFNLDSNMLQFTVGFAGAQGPVITFFNESFNFTYTTGSYCPCARTEVLIERAAGVQIGMNWSAAPSPGTSLTCYRWALDMADVSDDSPRRDDNDLSHWSDCTLNETGVVIGPFEGGEEHRLYVEARDNVGLRSLGIVRFQFVRSSFERELAIFDDTRRTPDQTPRDSVCVRRPVGRWPTATELDTFLYARGGVPWRCYPEGSISARGIFDGYAYDTIGTRVSPLDPGIRLSTLGRYRHVIWFTDYDAATFVGPPGSGVEPISALRYLATPGRINPLNDYVRQGGKLWCAGGGIAYASHITWNDRANDRPNGRTIFATTSTLHTELARGRFMYDLAHWQSSIGVSQEPASVSRFVGRFASSPDPNLPYSSFLAELPARLERKNVGLADPLPPYRTSDPSNFYVQTNPLEYLLVENRIVENLSTDPDEAPRLESTLDTLYEASGGTLPGPATNPHNVVMTYYHGVSIPQGFVFSGFAPWSFKRDQCKALVDFVLKRIWGLGSSPMAPTTAQGGASLERTRTYAAPASSRVVPTRPPWRRAPLPYYGRPPLQRSIPSPNPSP